APESRRNCAGPCRLRSGVERQGDGEDAALAWLAFDGQPSAVTIDDVLHDGEAQAGSAHFTRAGAVDPIEALRQSVQMLTADTLTAVADAHMNPGRGLSARTGDGVDPSFHIDGRAGAAVFDRVLDQV